MSDNEFRERFDACQTVRQVLISHGRAWMDTGYTEAELRAAMTDAAEARISQLQHNESPPADDEVVVCRITTETEARIAELSPRTVDAAGRERLVRALDENRWDGGLTASMLADELIDALGWKAAAEPEAAEEPELTSADWHVDFAPDELRTLAKVVDDFERLYNNVAQVVAPDTMRTTLDLEIIDGDLPVRVVCNDHGCWVLRIGGGDE